MTNTGPTVHRQLMGAYANAQEQLEALRRRMQGVAQQRQELADQRGEALVSLAEHYLPELTREAIQSTWRELRDRFSEILIRKEAHEQRLGQSLEQWTAQRTAAETQLLETNQQLDQSHQEQEALTAQVEQTLRRDEEFIALSDRAALAEAALERAEANLHEIDQDSARKLPPYENSTLFRYLYERGFGTNQYTKRGFTRRMDRLLAKFINYAQARQGYEFLKKTPEQMRRIIGEDRQALDTVMEELERRRDSVANQLGLPQQIAVTQTWEERRDNQIQSLDDLRVQTEQVQQELTQLEGGRGAYYREAISLFRELLDRSDVGELKRRAQSTPDITDDQIVARLVGVDVDFQQLASAAKQRNKELDQQQEQLEQLGRLVQRFRAARFDSDRSEFTDRLDIEEEIERARDGEDIKHLWDRIRRHHRWGPTTMEKVAGLANHPMAQVLIGAMAQAAGAALESHARRAGERRAQSRPWHSDANGQRRKKNSWSAQWGGDSSDDGSKYRRPY
jgi:hypothetical protein